ncbi:MAG: hypothetical protein HRT57_02230 [Crocinitomicaceae bacterium]|nr:hypothetical protein [Crocinitomicaceae bacterium]
MQDSIVAHYTLDGTAADSSVNGNHGTILGAVISFADRFGNPNGAMYFTGTGYINAGNSVGFQIQDDITI